MFDTQEYENIVRKYRPEIYRYCCARLDGDESLTEETVSDIMRILFEKWEQIDVRENIRAYLYRVADNCIRYTLRSHMKYYSHNESFEEAVENSRLDAEQNDEYFQSEKSDEEYMARLGEAIPAELREIYNLRYIEKKTIRQISEKTGIPYSSVRLRLKKIEIAARDEIRRMFED